MRVLLRDVLLHRVAPREAFQIIADPVRIFFRADEADLMGRGRTGFQHVLWNEVRVVRSMSVSHHAFAVQASHVVANTPESGLLEFLGRPVERFDGMGFAVVIFHMSCEELREVTWCRHLGEDRFHVFAG